MNPPECGCHTGNQYDNCENRREPFNRKVENALTAEAAPLQNFFGNFLSSDHKDYQHTGCKGGYWHHDGIGQEIKEIQKTHAKNLYTGKRAIPKGRKRAKKNHDSADNQGCFFPG